MLISFCAAHFFVLQDKLKYGVFPIYAVPCLPITFFAMAQFPLYFDLIWATFKKVPQGSFKVEQKKHKDLKDDHPEGKLIKDCEALIDKLEEKVLKYIIPKANRDADISYPGKNGR